MENVSWLIIAILAIIIVVIKVKESKPADNAEKTTAQEDYSNAYQKRFLLTKNEWYEFKKLQQYAETANLLICPKVRLLDIIEPRRGEGNYMSLLSKVQSKHIDFLVCDKNLHILGVIELDDNSHGRDDRKNRDEFVDQILNSVGYKVVHVRGVTENTLDVFTNKPLGE